MSAVWERHDGMWTAGAQTADPEAVVSRVQEGWVWWTPNGMGRSPRLRLAMQAADKSIVAPAGERGA